MTHGMLLRILLGVMLAGFFHVSFAQAQASRTWVSGVGDDVNPCSRTAPCKTFAGAISKTASGGEIDALDPGGFGALTITKPITIDGGGGQVASITVPASANGIVVQSGTGVVTLRNLRINGLGTGLNGVTYNSGAGLVMENCTIFGFGSNGLLVAPSTGGSQISIVNSSFYTNGGGVLVKPTGATANLTNITLTGVKAENNGFGIGIDTTGGGTASMIINQTVASQNAINGLQALGAQTTVLINNSVFSHNATGLNITSPANVSSFTNNIVNQNSTANTVGTLGTKSPT